MRSRKLFDRAIELVLEHEGMILTNPPADRGGPTKSGIAQRWHPDVDFRTLTREQAIEIYWERYWQGRGYRLLPEAITIKVFDLAANLGEKTTVRCLQRAPRPAVTGSRSTAGSDRRPVALSAESRRRCASPRCAPRRPGHTP